MKDILCALQSTCTFPQVFEQLESDATAITPRYQKKIGHLRADYDGWRWWNT